MLGIATLLTLFIGFGSMLINIGFGQGKAKTRESNFVSEIKSLKDKDVEFSEDIRGIKMDVSDIKLKQEKSHGELKLSISQLETNILKEFRKTNGHN